MNRSIEELKIRAKKLQQAAKRFDPQALAYLNIKLNSDHQLQRKTCLNVLARKMGFTDWSHARHVLSGSASIGQDMGKIWYENACSAHLNNWFASYDEAKQYLTDHPDFYLLPYKNQFIVADQNLIAVLGLTDECAGYWHSIGNNLVDGYGTDGWHALVWQRISRRPNPEFTSA
ncbi:MAG: hypothetical protein ACNI26_16935 [Terasakiella sp.]|uniref:hypothetical protein n=1 Tax=unclassified Terasakiella TaxID=2614952 RepID=UPI003B005AEB